MKPKSDYSNTHMEKEISIHDKEWDTEFIKRFKQFLIKEYNAGFSETEMIGPAGSQVLTVTPFTIGTEKLQLIAETYVGLSISGPAKTVQNIVANFKKI